MNYYAEHAQQLKRDLAAELPTDELRRLHQKRPLLHAAIGFGNFAVLAAAAVAIVSFDRWYLWLPFSRNNPRKSSSERVEWPMVNTSAAIIVSQDYT